MGFWDAYNSAYAASKTANDQARQSATTAQISGALANKDYDGAAAAAFRGGQYQTGSLLMQQAQAQRKTAALGALASSFAPATSGSLTSAVTGASGAAGGSLNPPPPPVAAPASSAASMPSLTPAPALSAAPASAPTPATGPVGPSATPSITVTGKPFSGSLYDLTRAPVHEMSANTANAARAALMAGVPMDQITSAISLAHQISDPDEEARSANADAVTKVAQQALGIDKGLNGSTDPNDISAARKAFVTTQIGNVVGDPTQKAHFLAAAQNFDYGDQNIQSFINQREKTADVIKQAREDAADAQKQASADRAATDREASAAETARHNRATEGIGQQNASAHMISARKAPLSINVGGSANGAELDGDANAAPSGFTPDQ